MVSPRIGVLALQGDVVEHLRALESLGARVVRVRRPSELDQLDGIVIPGGESTTIDKLSRIFEVREPLIDKIRNGLPAYGSCAGMILLADRIVDGIDDQQTFGGLDITVRRNAFGRQVDSFETDLDLDLGDVDGTGFHAVFIRAPWVEKTGADVNVLGRVPHSADPTGEGAIVAVRQQNLLATSFHPEVTGDTRLHAYFVGMTA
ncbi:pyridoxal 5'-phosphate synthase glutaminase subunit PdxT [Microlunatus sp. Gsoil 973]|uniref:pyridoxal 5'-phosphate synthase glutaminase subunit PdxT n=1 Tax=Microlunatus sp. Gsoil 973 TaxID=2672569 RepID=UPI0012B4E59D|nr:pyridoxal 5'-phosphate synthase glutaminase subunit PdxT [Microlunatus sp. Gsoil 973]QGN32689.1 pyridoxal 5'-phosphate synthase glutaminase subunit PdxT [Microlunatus sp. Gsoil 973]